MKTEERNDDKVQMLSLEECGDVDWEVLANTPGLWLWQRLKNLAANGQVPKAVQVRIVL